MTPRYFALSIYTSIRSDLDLGSLAARLFEIREYRPRERGEGVTLSPRGIAFNAMFMTGSVLQRGLLLRGFVKSADVYMQYIRGWSRSVTLRAGVRIRRFLQAD